MRVQNIQGGLIVARVDEHPGAAVMARFFTAGTGSARWHIRYARVVALIGVKTGQGD